MEFNKKAWKIGRISLNDRLVVKKIYIGFGFCDIRQYRSRGKCYQRRPNVLFYPGFHQNLIYRISSNNTGRGRLLFFFSHKKELIIRGRWLFQIIFTGSRALTILFYYPIKSKSDHIKWTEHGLFRSAKFGPLINFQWQYPRCQNLNRHW